MRQTVKFANLRAQRMGIQINPGLLTDWKSVPRWVTGAVVARNHRKGR